MESVMMCRLCHQRSGVVHIDLFESFDGEKYIEQISKYLSLKVERYDELSHLICHLCVFDLSLCSQLSETYYSTYCPGIILKSESNLCCCICSATEDTVEVDKEITKLIEKAKNCLSYENKCLLLRETATKFLCIDCLFKLNEISQFYSKVRRDEIAAEKLSSTTSTIEVLEIREKEKLVKEDKILNKEKVVEENVVEEEKAVEEKSVEGELVVEEEKVVEDDKNEEDKILNKEKVVEEEKEVEDDKNDDPDFRPGGQKIIRYGPSTTRWPKTVKPCKTCPICKNKGRSNRICKKCVEYSQSVKVFLVDLRHCKTF